MTSMIKLLRTLGLLGALDLAVPESIDLPIARLEREQRKIRRRGRGRRGAPSADSTEATQEPWRWGREPGSGL
jgi:hypothetical protein